MTDQLTEIRAFATRWDYDMSYQEELLREAPDAFRVFARAQGLSAHRRHLPIEAHAVACVAMMLAEDCGDCTRLNLRMAREAGVDPTLLETLLERPEALPSSLRDVRDHAFAVSRETVPSAERIARLREAYGAGGVAELAVVLSGCRLFTTVKRALRHARPVDAVLGEW